MAHFSKVVMSYHTKTILLHIALKTEPDLSDIKLLEQSHIIQCAPTHKNSSYTRNISLFPRPYTCMSQVVVCSTSTGSMQGGIT